MQLRDTPARFSHHHPTIIQIPSYLREMTTAIQRVDEYQTMAANLMAKAKGDQAKIQKLSLHLQGSKALGDELHATEDQDKINKLFAEEKVRVTSLRSYLRRRR
jgi:hypothetical protein